MLFANTSAISLKQRSTVFTCYGCVLFLVAIAIPCSNAALWGQPPDPQPVDTDPSWTRSGESHDAIGTVRYVESHTKSGDRTSDTQLTMHRLADGRYEISLESSRETVQVDSSTVRTVTRTYTANANGGKILVQVTEEETHLLPDGGSKSLRTVSRSDLNGNLQQVQGEIGETRRIGADMEETKTTVLQASINGGFQATARIDEHRNFAGNNTQFDKTTQILDGSGNWQISEVRRGTIQEDGKNRMTDERVSRPDYEGNLREVSRTVTAELDNGSEKKRNTTGSYSIDLPGTTRDGELHLVQRKTKMQSPGSNGQQTIVQQVEQPSPGDPRAGLRVVVISTENARTVSSGTEATRIIQVRDANGNFDVVSVDISKSNQTNAVQVQIAPSNNSTN